MSDTTPNHPKLNQILHAIPFAQPQAALHQHPYVQQTASDTNPSLAVFHEQ